MSPSHCWINAFSLLKKSWPLCFFSILEDCLSSWFPVTELWHGLDTTELHWLCWKKKKRKEWGRQSERNGTWILWNLPPSLPPLSPITVHESIRNFNVQHNGQEELFCDYNARKCYLSAKNVMTTEAPGTGNNQWGSWCRCPPPVKIFYCDMYGRAGRVTVDRSVRAEKQLKSQLCYTTNHCTTLYTIKHRHSHATKTRSKKKTTNQNSFTTCKLLQSRSCFQIISSNYSNQ